MTHYPDAVATLIYSNNSRIRKQAWSILTQSLERQCVEGQPNLSNFRDHITGPHQKPNVATPLKRALFEAAPLAAFFFYSGEWANREIEQDEIIPYRRKQRIVDNALFEKKWLGGIPRGKVDDSTTAVLRELAASKYWWSRLFVAEIMVQNKEFRDADLIKSLQDDEDPLVRNSVASLERPDPLRAAAVDR